MSDVIAKLRYGDPCWDAAGGGACRVRDAASGCLCAIAANEIESLRAGNCDLQLHFDVLKADYDRLRLKVEPLRAALEQISRMKVCRNAAINQTTLAAAIQIASAALVKTSCKQAPGDS